MAITNITRQTVIAQSVEIASTPLARMQGLLGRASLSPSQALVITSCQSIHMLFMRFAIDVIFIDGKNKAVGLVQDIQPFQFSSVFWKSACAIETAAGTIERSQTQLGDEISIVSP